MIRPVQPEDLYYLVEIEARAAPKSQYTLWELRSLQLRYPDTFLVADSGRIDGYIVFTPQGHIISMAVAPDRRRQGIGRRLMQEAARHCCGEMLYLEVRAGNQGAQEFYRRLGFRERARVRRYYHDEEDAVIMERPPGQGG